MSDNRNEVERSKSVILLAQEFIKNNEYDKLELLKVIISNDVDSVKYSFSLVTGIEFEQKEMKSISELETEIYIQKKQYINQVLVLLKSDPCASDYTKNYKELEEYLYEVMEKDDSLLDGLIAAMEVYLNK
jgi:hypothetical protein